MDVRSLSSEISEARYELRFVGITPYRSDVAIPCDARGSVDINRLSEPMRNHYFFARMVVGREFRAPTVSPVEC